MKCIEFISPSASSISLQKIVSKFKDNTLRRVWKAEQLKENIIVKRRTQQDQEDCLIM